MTSQFLWRPGHGPDAAALERMRGAFPRPKRPMGEAWFMTEKRKMYPELMSMPPEEISTKNIGRYLEEIGSGTSSFGPLDGEWSDWLHYLLPRVILPHRDRYVFQESLEESLISAFITQYPNCIEGGYQEFESDVLLTLGQWIMQADLWKDGDVRDHSFLHKEPCDSYPWKWYEASGDLSATLFFCWKYLKPEEIDGWLGSVFAIKGAHWCAQILVWLLGVRQVLAGEITQPTQFDSIEPKIEWESAHYLKGRYDGDYQTPTRIPFLSPANIDAFRNALRKHITDELFFEWLDAFARFDYLTNELSTLPDDFAAAYLAR